MNNDPTTGGSGSWFAKNKRPLIIGGSMVGIAAVVAIIVAIVLANGDDEDDDAASPDASPSPSASVSATASPSPTESATPAPSETASGTSSTTATATAGAEQIEWTVSAPQPVPPGSVLYIEKGCWQCDGPTDALQRVRATGAPGSVTLDPRILFDDPDGTDYISSTYVSPRGNDVWLTVCGGDSCGGVAAVSDNAASTLFHSDDGGITWVEVETFEGGVKVEFVSAGIPIMAEALDGGGSRYFALQGGDVEPPEDGATPAPFSSGDNLYWMSSDNLRLLESDGTVVFESDRTFMISGNPSEAGDVFLVQFLPASDNGAYGLVEGGQVVQEFEGPFVMTGAWLDTRTAIGNASLLNMDIPGVADPPNGSVPVLIDFETGQLTPLEVYGPLADTPDYEGRNRVRGLDRGVDAATNAYVVVSPDDCLNVRESPSQSAAVVHCWADGVILWVPGKEPTEAEGITWYPVVGPDTSTGWASMEFLQP